tara:strand:+ start:45023 stop:45235 length:213 start_codon:yes stop_codon:yes gene_type:complete
VPSINFQQIKAKKASKRAVFKPLGLPAFSGHLKISSRIVQGGRQERKPEGENLRVFSFYIDPSLLGRDIK